MNKENKPEKLSSIFYFVVLLIAVGGVSVLWILCLCFIGKQEPRLAVFFPLAVNWLILTAIFVQAYIYKRQAEMMREGLNKTQALIEQTERHFKLTVRPALGIERVYLEMKPDKIANAVGLLVNSGKVSATIISQEFAFDYVLPSDDIYAGNGPEPPPPTKMLGKSTIHIGGKREINYGRVWPPHWIEMKAERQILFIWTKITYKGITDEKYILEHYAGFDIRQGVFIEWPTHNQAT